MQCKSGNKKCVWNAQRKMPNQLQKMLNVNFRTPDTSSRRESYFITSQNVFTKLVPKISKCVPTPPRHPFCQITPQLGTKEMLFQLFFLYLPGQKLELNYFWTTFFYNFCQILILRYPLQQICNKLKIGVAGEISENQLLPYLKSR